MTPDLESVIDEARGPTGRTAQQFSMSSLLWMTTAAALLVGHARTLGPQATQLLFVCALYWTAAATVFSLLSRDPKEVVYWSALIVVQAFLAVTAVRIFGFSQASGWGLVGAVCGAYCGAQLMLRPVLSSLTSGLLGAVAMAAVLMYSRESMDVERWLDLIGAAVVGTALWHFIKFLRWFLVASGQPRAVLAAWITLSVLVGNWLVKLNGY